LNENRIHEPDLNRSFDLPQPSEASGRILQTERRIQVLSAQFFLGTTPKLFAPAAWLTSFAPQAMRTLSYFLISQHLGSFNEVSLLPSNQ
jgi:hypothetical protein